MEIRALTENDAGEYRQVRLRSLQEHPEAFGMSYEEELKIPSEDWNKRLREANSAEKFTLGAFVEGNLIGLAGFTRYTTLKFRHTAHISQMYVTPELRGQQIGKALLEEAIRRGRSLEGLEKIILSVVPINVAARNLYLSLGFQTQGVEKQALKVDGSYYDLENLSLWLD